MHAPSKKLPRLDVVRSNVLTPVVLAPCKP